MESAYLRQPTPPSSLRQANLAFYCFKMSRLSTLHAYLILTPFFLVLLSRSVDAQTNPFTWSGVRYDCKCSDLDACWPSTSLWSQLNTTVGGNLQKVRGLHRVLSVAE